jgi:hypothetical protein
MQIPPDAAPDQGAELTRAAADASAAGEAGVTGAALSWLILRNDKPVEEGDCLKDGFQHHFVREQIQAEMNEAGLEMVNYEGGTCYGHAVGLIPE